MQITATIEPSNEAPPDGFDPGASAWEITLEFQGRTLIQPFFTGSLVKSFGLGDVLGSLYLDAHGVMNAKDFEDWADEYGYDTDSRAAEKIYHSVKAGVEALSYFLEGAFDTFLALDLEKIEEIGDALTFDFY